MGFSKLEFLGQIASFERRLRGAAQTPLALPYLFRAWTGSGMWAERDKREVLNFLYFGRYTPELLLDLGIIVVILTLTRIIMFVVTGQAPVTLELRNTPGKTNKQTNQRWYTHITADAIHASARNIYKVKSGVSVIGIRVTLGAAVAIPLHRPVCAGRISSQF